MMTVKEMAERTKISARTLHYYDEIGLLKPTAKSEAGYRLYDEKVLETLEQILRKLLERKEFPKDSFEFREIVAEYGFAIKMLYQIQNEKPVMLQIAETYRVEQVREKTDETYGAGAAEFFAEAIEAFYK